MVKISSRDALEILRDFKIAANDNIPRNIESIKTFHPSEHNFVTGFIFQKKQYYVLVDDSAEDNEEYIISQIKSINSEAKGQLLPYPNSDIGLTYSAPYKGKDSYLFVIISDKKRLDAELARRYSEVSRSTWQKYVKLGLVSVNGVKILSPKQDITDLDLIEIQLPEINNYDQDSLPIVYIDDNIIVINKPIGVLSHAKGAINDEFTVADFFKRYTTYNADTNRPGIIHRLDRDTSGIMIGARNEDTAKLLQKQFADRKTKKTYMAVLVGFPKIDKAIINLPINRNPSKPSTFRVESNGKSAITKYEVLKKSDKYSLVKLQPQTGRTHQLRVHMSYIGTPILGDRVYGVESSRLYLHAESLEITIPGGERRTFVAEVPAEFYNLFV